MNIRAIASELSTMRDLVRWGVSRFNQAELCFAHGMPTALDEAVYLCLAALHLPPDFSADYFDCRLTHDEKCRVLEYYRQRLQQRRPAAYITREAWFAGLSFYVDERVLIPRSPVAELIRQQFSPWIEYDGVGAILDLCTGSGCIAIACAYAFEHARVVASDVSADALTVAAINIDNHGMQERVELVEADLFENVPARRFDIIVSNPPYIAAADPHLSTGDIMFEPVTALVSGADGLDDIRRITAQATGRLKTGGWLVLEHGYDQQPAVAAILRSAGFTDIELQCDLANIPRMAAGRHAGA